MEARRKDWLVRSLVLAALSCAPVPGTAGPVGPRVSIPPGPDAPPAPARPALRERETKPPCHDELGAELAKLSCDGERILLAGRIEVNPARPAPAEPSRRLLAAAVQLLRSHPEILLVRIEVGVGRDVGKSVEKRRAELAEAQRRADALFAHLWRHEGISAERLEAVAYPYSPERQDGTRFPVALRVVQRAE
ncbi:MAG: hypothetical protein U0263_42165 [Polyangiaceae bacterium]